ncbi:MAG: hypothetical protein ABI668_06025 [Sphingorhabdus sp.]
MSKKASAARTEAFFQALAETGNQTISAERARVSRSWVSLHRSADPEFKARMEACIAEARARLSTAGSVKHSGKWANIDGEELVVRGSRGRRAQISRARLKQWTLRGEQRFLSVLRATCNLELACREVGLSVPSVYKHADRWPRFAGAWKAALEEGYHALELAMLENGMRSLDPDAAEEMDWEPAIPMEPMTPEQGLALLHMNKHSAFRHWARRTGVRG